MTTTNSFWTENYVIKYFRYVIDFGIPIWFYIKANGFLKVSEQKVAKKR